MYFLNRMRIRSFASLFLISQFCVIDIDSEEEHLVCIWCSTSSSRPNFSSKQLEAGQVGASGNDHHHYRFQSTFPSHFFTWNLFKKKLASKHQKIQLLEFSIPPCHKKMWMAISHYLMHHCVGDTAWASAPEGPLNFWYLEIHHYKAKHALFVFNLEILHLTDFFYMDVVLSIRKIRFGTMYISHQ